MGERKAHQFHGVWSKRSRLTSYLFVPIWQKERNPREPLGEGLLANGEGPEASDEESQSQSVGASKRQSREQQELYEVAPKGKTFPEENVDEQRETHRCHYGHGWRVLPRSYSRLNCRLECTTMKGGTYLANDVVRYFTDLQLRHMETRPQQVHDEFSPLHME